MQHLKCNITIKNFLPKADSPVVKKFLQHRKVYNPGFCNRKRHSTTNNGASSSEKSAYILQSMLAFFSILVFSFAFHCFAQDKFGPLEKINNEESVSSLGFIYDAKGKRNPFIPLVTADGRLLKLDVEETKGDLAIEGIIYDEQGVSYAIVNGSVVKAGDIIGNAQVLRVEKDKVVFIKDSREIELELLNKYKAL